MNNSYKLVKDINQFDLNSVFFCEPTKNNIMEDGTFIRIMYSNSIFTLNGIYLLLNVNYNSVDKYYNKLKCVFDVEQYKYLINKICLIENAILDKIESVGKVKQLKLNEQFKNGCLKVFSETNQTNNYGDKIILKISGIWETDNEYGLTYKLVFGN